MNACIRSGQALWSTLAKNAVATWESFIESLGHQPVLNPEAGSCFAVESHERPPGKVGRALSSVPHTAKFDHVEPIDRHTATMMVSSVSFCWQVEWLGSDVCPDRIPRRLVRIR